MVQRAKEGHADGHAFIAAQDDLAKGGSSLAKVYASLMKEIMEKL
jgi:hypothetical protein